MTVQTHANHLEITLSGSADIGGLTPETRSSVAFLVSPDFCLVTRPIQPIHLPDSNHTTPLPSISFPMIPLPPHPTGRTFDNWLRDPALSYSASTEPIGFFYGDQFETPDPTDTYGELYLPISYLSGTELSGSLTLTNRTLADFGWVGGESWSFSWNAGQDSLTLNVVPEPTTLASILCATLGLQAFRSMQRNPRELRRKAPPPL